MWQVTILLIGIIPIAISSLVAAQPHLEYLPGQVRSYPRNIASLTILLAIFLLSSCTNATPREVSISIPFSHINRPTCETGTLRIDGSITTQRLIQHIADSYMNQCPSAHITVSGGDSLQGLNDVESGAVDIGNSDIPAPQSSLYRNLYDHLVAAVIDVLIVHPSPNLDTTNLTTDEIQKIYNGTYTNWDQLGNASQPIRVISGKVGSGIRTTFDENVLKGSSEQSTSYLAASTEEVVHDVQMIPGAVGYISLADALQVYPYNSLNVIQEIDCQPYTDFADSSYPFWHLDHLYTKGPPQQLAQAFIIYMGSPIAQQNIANDSFGSVQGIPNRILGSHYQ